MHELEISQGDFSMKLNKQQFDKVKSALDWIVQNCSWFQNGRLDRSQFTKYNRQISYSIPDFSFPGENESFDIDLEGFIRIAEDVTSIDVSNREIIKCQLRRFHIVYAPKGYDNEFLNCVDIEGTQYGNIEISLNTCSFILGLAATKLCAYDEDYHGAVSSYAAVEVIYKSADEILDLVEEKKLVQSFLFEVADSTDVTLKESRIGLPHEGEVVDISNAVNHFKLRDIENWNEGMRFFVSAIQIDDPQLKYLNFYKILEHFAPVAVNIEANEMMRIKLDAPKAQFENGDFIRSIFHLAKSMREKFNDEDLIKATFNTCFDFIAVFEKLPSSIKKRVLSQIKEGKLSYDIDKQKVTTACNMVGKILYETRNNVVHAKANYELKGNECPESEISTLNEFMKEASSLTIRWYNRQPEHLKLAII